MFDMVRYHLGWIDKDGRELTEGNGKALRPVLCLVSCAALCKDHSRALPAAAAVEMVHNFSLVHDDIQDNDDRRRGRPTVWSIWGKPQAINAGTALRVLAGTAVSRLGGYGVGPDRQMLAQRMLDVATLDLVEGQYLDISFENRLDITTDDYLKMIEKKTARLISCSLELGALIGGGSITEISAFRELGRNLGLAFQVRDDMLGIWGRPENTGKPLFSDIRRRKKTLPVVYAFENASRDSRRDMLDIYTDGRASTVEGIQTVLSILEEVRAREAALTIIDSYRTGALELLHSLNIPPRAQNDLEEIINFLSDREF